MDSETVNVLECPQEIIDCKPGREYRNIVNTTYTSAITGTDRPVNISLPADYSEDKKYSVLYCLHGYFCHEGTMLYDEDSRIPEILGNMYDAGLTREVIAVFPNGYVTSDPGLSPGFSQESIAPYDSIMDEIIGSIEPFLQENYSVLSGRENRAVLGFSFGAREAIYMGMLHPDVFGHVCAAAPAPGVVPGKDWAMEHPGLFTNEAELKYHCDDAVLDTFILCRGSKDSVVGTFPVEYHRILEANDIQHIWFEVPEFEHGEGIVQSGLYNLMIRWK